MRRSALLFGTLAIVTVSALIGCLTSERVPGPGDSTNSTNRTGAIPADSEKVLPGGDRYPPQLHSEEFREPIPLGGNVNTAGAEDSPFVTPDGETLYFWFTPDVDVPVEEQLLDGVTGIYVSRRLDEGWTEAARVVLSHDVSLDGCPFVLEDRIWFCSARPGYTGMRWFTARRSDGEWVDWEEADFDPDHDVGELHISADGGSLYYHSDRPGGKGSNDIWVSRRVGGEWSEPLNIENVNSEADDSRPFLSRDGRELWFTRTYRGTPAVFRSILSDGEWQEPDLMVSQFAGEPTLDGEGNLYFVHHFFEDGRMIEADIYLAVARD